MANGNVKPRSQQSLQLRDELLRRGYPQELADTISYELNTDYTAGRMLGYLAFFTQATVEQVVDEMLAILSDREQYIQKKTMEASQAYWNEWNEEQRRAGAGDAKPEENQDEG